MNKPSKCIAVATPFGALYLELGDNEVYKANKDNGVLIKLSALYGGGLSFFYNSDSWVTVQAVGGGRSVLNVIARYGDSFPQ